MSERTILIVDDAALFRDLESLFLVRSGRVITADGGESALAILRQERPDVAVVDLDMPGVAGDALCRILKADPALADLPVILVLGSECAEDHERAVRAGADDVIAKPIHRIGLIQAVNRFLRGPLVPGLPRVALDAQVRIRCECEEAWGTVRNLSRGGLFVQASRTVPPDTEVELHFSLPEHQVDLHSTARVVWRRVESAQEGSGMGLQFLAIDRSSAAEIERFVSENAPSDPLRRPTGSVAA